MTALPFTAHILPENIPYLIRGLLIVRLSTGTVSEYLLLITFFRVGP